MCLALKREIFIIRRKGDKNMVKLNCRNMKQGRLFVLLIFPTLVSVVISAEQGSQDLIVNGGFEQIQDNQPLGWNELWTREPSVGELRCDRKIAHSGECSVRIEHRGQKDWSLNHIRTFDVEAGDIFEFAGWINADRRGSAEICVITYDKDKKVMDWSYGGRKVKQEGK